MIFTDDSDYKIRISVTKTSIRNLIMAFECNIPVSYYTQGLKPMTFDPSNFLLRWKWIGWCRLNTYHSVQFSCSVVSNSLWPHGPVHARQPCPSSTPGVYPNSCLLSWWYHPTISSPVIPFSSCLQSFPASGSFQMNQMQTSLHQVSTSASVLPMSTQDWSPLRTDIIKEFQLHSWRKKYYKTSIFLLMT